MSKYISVFIPTFNGEKYLPELLDAVIAQDLPDGYKLEILITDSGSKDKTVEIITKHYIDHVILDQIPNSQFGHGRTRQRAAEKARGEYILFLSQDATPTSHRWIKNMIEPFLVGKKVGCVFGRQVPRPSAVAPIKREVASVFAGLGAPDAITIHRQRSLVDKFKMNPLNTFFSDVNSAIRKDILNQIPFRDVKYAEDQALAKDFQKAGYLKAYSAAGAVWHSNEYTVSEFHKRKFDEYVGLQESVDYQIKPSTKSLLLGWIRPTLLDWKFIIHDQEYSKRAKAKNAILSIGYNFAAGLGKYHAAKFKNNKTARKKFSLEESRR